MATPPTFSAGAVLTAAQMNQLGLFLIKTVTIGAGVTSVPVTDAFNADYENYRIVFSGGTGSVEQSAVIQLNNSSGSTYQVFGYYGSYGVATLIAYGPGPLTSWTDAIRVGPNGYSAVVDICNPYTSGKQTQGFSNANTNTTAYSWAIRDSSTASNTGFTLSVTGGVTLTGGTIRVYGYRN
jgi:hypothetical protein